MSHCARPHEGLVRRWQRSRGDCRLKPCFHTKGSRGNRVRSGWFESSQRAVGWRGGPWLPETWSWDGLGQKQSWLVGIELGREHGCGMLA